MGTSPTSEPDELLKLKAKLGLAKSLVERLRGDLANARAEVLKLKHQVHTEERRRRQAEKVLPEDEV